MNQEYFELEIPHTHASSIFTFCNERINFNAEIELWCRENLRHYPRKTVRKRYNGANYNNSYYGYVLEMIDECDLILFKMRWL
jgi:hypothetical protein